MKYLFLTCLFVFAFLQSGFKIDEINSIDQINFSEIKGEIKWFIDKIKKGSVEQGRYNVYMVKLFDDLEENRYCASIGFIQDSLFISYVEGFKYYISIEEELILLDYSDDFKSKYNLKDSSINLLVNEQIIADKIYTEGVMFGTTQGYVTCYENGNIIKIYYDNSEEIPYDKAIFKYTSYGSLIEYDSVSFKKMLNDKKNNR